MTLRPTPWATSGGIDGKGGAENSVELARVGNYAATSGATGIIEPTDLKVTALPVPGGAVRVRMGTGIIKSTYPGVFGQSYAVQEDSYTDVPVSATGSSGAAVKYVYILIEDTQYNGQQPTDVKTGPYNSYQVTTSLPSNKPYLLLAKINQPANTGAITNAMITDLREVANPRKDYGIFARPRVAGDNEGTTPNLITRWSVDGKEYYGEYFPGGDGVPNTGTIFLPDWATHMVVSAKWMGLSMNTSANPRGRYWIEFGDEYRSHTWANGKQFEFTTQQFGFSPTQTEWSLEDAVPIPKKLRGKDVTFCFKAGLNTGVSTSSVAMYSLGGISCRVDYVQQREDPDTI